MKSWFQYDYVLKKVQIGGTQLTFLYRNFEQPDFAEFTFGEEFSQLFVGYKEKEVHIRLF